MTIIVIDNGIDMTETVGTLACCSATTVAFR